MSKVDDATKRTVNEQPESISPFPPVHDDDIDKHRHLNEEAEKNSKLKDKHEVHPDYLKRFKLERKALAEKNRLLRLEKKRLMLQAKRNAVKPKVKEVKDEFLFSEPVPIPTPRIKDMTSKPVKTILGFRYSQAIEEYYRGKLRHVRSFVTLLKDTDDENAKEEIVNGWYVRTVGAQVLNLHARSLPSCNPVEIRLRRQHAILRQRGDSSKSLLSIHRSLSRDSVSSRVLLRSRESMSVLKSIDEDRESNNSRQSNHRVDHYEGRGSDTLTTLGSPSRLSSLSLMSGDHEFYRVGPKPKSMSLRLPAIVTEER